MEDSDNSAEAQFKHQLLEKYNLTQKSVLMKKDEYFTVMDELKNASQAAVKTPRQYYILKKLSILLCGDVEKLVRKSTDPAADPVYYAHMDDVYDIIKRTHIATGHGGRDKMLKVLSVKYSNITTDAVDLFKSLCMECLKKRKRQAIKGVVVLNHSITQNLYSAPSRYLLRGGPRPSGKEQTLGGGGIENR